MAKLKHIIKQLSQRDYEEICDSLLKGNAEKSAYLLQSMREKSLSDAKIMEELDVNTNAYYTLRSRLNQKIEEYLLQQMESPRTDLLKKVANINEVIFTKKKAISVTTLKKLEKELLDYDLSNELTIVYKALKKLHINTPDHYGYSQLYNKHIAYMLALDKAEDILAEYFKRYGMFALTGDEVERLGLSLMIKEMDNVCQMYQSHRLYVYQNCLSVFHRLFVEQDDLTDEDKEPIEDILNKIEEIFETYYLDSIYFHLNLVFEYLRLDYYNYYKVYRKVEKYFDEVNTNVSSLMTNFSLYTFPPQFLSTRMERYLRLGIENTLYEENEKLFIDYETDKEDVPRHLFYVAYRALSCYYANKYDEAARWINTMFNEMSLKKYPHAMLEVKVLLALQYCCMKDFDLFNQLVNSIQRQIRILGKETCEDIVLLVKMMKTSISDAKKDKATKVKALVTKYQMVNKQRVYSPTSFLKMDESFIERLAE